MNRTWTPENDNFLLEYYGTKGAQYCADFLGRTITSVYKRANRLDIRSELKKSIMSTEEYSLRLFEKEINCEPAEDYKGFDTAIKHKCVDNHIWTTKPKYVIANLSNCPVCSHNNMKGKTILYYIKVTYKERVYWKIGITNESVRKRFAGDTHVKIDVVWEHEYAHRVEARAVEFELLTLFKDKLVKNANVLRSGGNSELFSEDILGCA